MMRRMFSLLLPLLPSAALAQPNQPVPPIGAAPPFLRTRQTVSSAQILALNTTPIVLVPAPAANQIVEIWRIHIELIFGTIAYTGGTLLNVRYGTSTGPTAATAPSNGAFTGVASGITSTPSLVGGAAFTSAGLRVVLSNSGNYTLGDGTGVITTYYTLENLG